MTTTTDDRAAVLAAYPDKPSRDLLRSLDRLRKERERTEAKLAGLDAKRLELLAAARDGSTPISFRTLALFTGVSDAGIIYLLDPARKAKNGKTKG